MATVSSKVFRHHKKADGTYNVKICLYHKNERVYMDTAHYVTYYWARHSFANLARNSCRRSKDNVALALNHVDQTRKTTDIYLAEDWSIIDDVQISVIMLLRKLDRRYASLNYRISKVLKRLFNKSKPFLRPVFIFGKRVFPRLKL